MEMQTKENNLSKLNNLKAIKIVLLFFSLFVLIMLLPSFSKKLPKVKNPEKSSNETEYLAMCLKTGMETMIDRVPMQLMTFLKNENLMIISDYEESIAGIEVINVLPLQVQRITFPKYRHAKSILEDEQSPDQKGGWRLDTHKNIPGFRRMYYEFPNAYWYIMFDDDSYIFKNNLISHLKTLDHTQPLYLGNGLGLSTCGDNSVGGLFAHGGSGIVLSRIALEKVLPIMDKCNQKFGKCFAGDMMLAFCLHDAGILLDSIKSQFDFRGSPFHKEAFRDACDMTFFFHHLFPYQIKQLYDLNGSAA